MEKKYTLVAWNLNGAFPDLSEYFNIIDIEGYENADAYLLWSEQPEISQLVCRYAKAFDRPVFISQHGFANGWIGGEYDGVTLKEKNADKYFVWGNINRDCLYEGGWREEDIINIGCPLFNHKLPYVPDGKSVGFAPMHSTVQDEEFAARHKIVDIDIWRRLRGIPDIIPIAKVLAEEDMFKIYLGYQFMTSRNTTEQADHTVETYRYLSNLEVLVTSYISTLTLLCFSIGLPVIKIINEPSPECQPGAVNIGVGELENTIESVVSGKIDLADEMNTVLNKYCSYNPDPAKTMADAINKEIEERQAVVLS